MREGERDKVSVDVSLCHFISLFVFALCVCMPLKLGEVTGLLTWTQEIQTAVIGTKDKAVNNELMTLVRALVC